MSKAAPSSAHLKETYEHAYLFHKAFATERTDCATSISKIDYCSKDGEHSSLSIQEKLGCAVLYIFSCGDSHKDSHLGTLADLFKLRMNHEQQLYFKDIFARI